MDGDSEGGGGGEHGGEAVRPGSGEAARRDAGSPARALGAHVSIAGGLTRAVERAETLDATALQLFTGQPQRWADRELVGEEVEAFRSALEASSVRVATAHDSYLINLASEKHDLFRRSLSAFRRELDRCTRLGLDALVTHPGNATGGDRTAALERNARALAEALKDRPGGPRVLLETTAGSGTALGWRFEELAALLEALPADVGERVGVCLDTAHVFAAGYDLRGDAGGVLEEFDRTVGLDRLELFHLNDSRSELGSRVDRHAHVGEGELGEAAFAALLRLPATRHVPGVIETPKGEDPTAEDRRNLARLRRLEGTSPATPRT